MLSEFLNIGMKYCTNTTIVIAYVIHNPKFKQVVKFRKYEILFNIVLLTEFVIIINRILFYTFMIYKDNTVFALYNNISINSIIL